MGKKEEAERLYLKLINEFNKSPEASASKRYLNQLRGVPANEGPAPPQWDIDHQVWACPNCGKTSSMNKFSKCPKCLQEVQSTIAYRRYNIERILFIPFLMAIIFGLSFLSTDSEVKAFPLLVPAVYVLGREFLGCVQIVYYLEIRAIYPQLKYISSQMILLLPDM